MQKQTQLANELWPLFLPRITMLVAGLGAGAAAGAGGGGGVLTEHALAGGLHTGQLADVQAPQFLKLDGTRALTGNLAVADTVTIDGVDISAHAANPDAHHARQHSIISSADHTVAGSAWQVVGLTGANTLGLLTPASDVTGATKEALLKSDANGYLSLVRAVASDRLRAPTIDTASGNLTIEPAGDVVFNPVGNDILPATNYDLNLGAINRKYLTLWAAELWVETLVAQDTIATIGGRILVGPTTTLTRDLGSAAGDTTIYVKHNQMSSGDRVYMEAAGKIEFMAVTSAYALQAEGDYAYTVTRNLDGSGRNLWYAGDAMFNTGQPGNGFIDLYSLSGIPRQGQSGQRAGPTIVGNVRIGTNYNNFRERWAIGNLNALYDYSGGEYGAAFGDPTAAWIGMDAVNGVRVMDGATKRMQADMAGNLRLYDSAGTAVIALDSDGSSYFANVMTIGSAGEIRQGTGTWGTNWTGLRLWHDSGVGRIGGYKANVLQWYGDTLGELRAGGGLVAMAGDGYNMARYVTEVGAPIAGTESRAALAWWDNIDSRTGAPLARAYAGRSDAGTGAVPALAFEVDPGNANVNRRGSIWLTGSDPGYGNAPSLRLYNIFNVVGIPGIHPQRNPSTLADSVYFSGSLYLQAHLLRDPAISAIDIGEATRPFRTVYADQVIANTISGASMAGQTWTYAGSMVIDAKASGVRTVSIANTFAGGSADLVVGRNITLGGTVDGVDLASFKGAYDSHIVAYAVHIGDANAHHAQAHGLDSSDHTGTLAWAKVSKTGSALADLATRPHSALTGIGADDHHNQAHGIVSSDHTVTGSALQLVGLSTTNTLALLTPSSNPGSASAILRTTAGALTLAQLTISAAGYLYVDGTLDFGTNTLYEDATYLQVSGAKPVRIGSAITLYPTENVGLGPDIQFATNGLLAAETSLYINIDSDNNSGTAALIIQRDAATSAGTELARVDESGMLAVLTKVRVPLIDTASGDLTINPASRTLFADDKQIRSQTHTSGFLGTGFAITWPLAGKPHLDIRSAYMETLEVTAFQADVMRVRVAEDFLTQSMGFVAEAFTTAAVGSSVRVQFENNPAFPGQIFANNEWVLIQVIQHGTGLLAKQIWGQVSSYIDEGNDRQSWLFTTRQGAGQLIAKSSLALSFGVSGDGYIHHNVLRSANGPWTRYATWSGANPYTPAYRRNHAQAGNLNGLVDIVTNRYGIAAGNNLALTPATGFSGFTADDTAGLRLFNTAIAMYSGALNTGAWNADGTLYAGFDGIGTQTDRDFSIATDFVRIGRSTDSSPNLFWSKSGSYMALRAGTAQKIRLDTNGDSYFAGVMTIGTAGEIRQGTGTLGSNYTGLRIWRDGNIGRIAGYNANAVQWSADTDGKLRAGGGAVEMDANGERILRPSWVDTSGWPEPGSVVAPVGPAAAAQALQFRDTAAGPWEWTNFPSGTKANYSYPGNTTLQIYASSRHYVPSAQGGFGWDHYIDGVIEAPAITGAGEPTGTYWRRLWLLAPQIYLSGDLVTVDADTMHLSGLTTSAAAVGTYAGKIKVKINGVDRWIPYYAS